MSNRRIDTELFASLVIGTALGCLALSFTLIIAALCSSLLPPWNIVFVLSVLGLLFCVFILSVIA